VLKKKGLGHGCVPVIFCPPILHQRRNAALMDPTYGAVDLEIQEIHGQDEQPLQLLLEEESSFYPTSSLVNVRSLISLDPLKLLTPNSVKLALVVVAGEVEEASSCSHGCTH
jgi:hypothetical protein